MYSAGYTPSTTRKACSAPPMRETNQGMKVGWMTARKMASVRKMVAIVGVERPKPPVLEAS